jgi:hypothetical protein
LAVEFGVCATVFKTRYRDLGGAEESFITFTLTTITPSTTLTPSCLSTTMKLLIFAAGLVGSCMAGDATLRAVAGAKSAVTIGGDVMMSKAAGSVLNDAFNLHNLK